MLGRQEQRGTRREETPPSQFNTASPSSSSSLSTAELPLKTCSRSRWLFLPTGVSSASLFFIFISHNESSRLRPAARRKIHKSHQVFGFVFFCFVFLNHYLWGDCISSLFCVQLWQVNRLSRSASHQQLGSFLRVHISFSFTGMNYWRSGHLVADSKHSTVAGCSVQWQERKLKKKKNSVGSNEAPQILKCILIITFI